LQYHLELFPFCKSYIKANKTVAQRNQSEHFYHPNSCFTLDFVAFFLAELCNQGLQYTVLTLVERAILQKMSRNLLEDSFEDETTLWIDFDILHFLCMKIY
jgi:hypothetical protein